MGDPVSSPSRTAPVQRSPDRSDDPAFIGPRAAQDPVKPATTTQGTAVTTKPGETVDAVRQRAFTQMAQGAGLSPAATREFVQRAGALDNGGLNAPASDAKLEPQARSETQARQAIDRGQVNVAPTQAQAGLLNRLRAEATPDPNLLSQPFSLPFGLPFPSGAGVGSVLPKASNQVPGVPGQAGVTPEVAQSILQNVAEGKPPFKPELGEHGPVSWFTTGGNPRTGTSADKSVTIPVEVANTSGKPTLQFGERELLAIYNRQLPAATQVAEQQLRERTGKVNGEVLSNTNLRDINYNADKIARLAMWKEVGETVAASESGIGKVKLENSIFSRNADGEFTLTSRAENVRLPKGAAAELVEAIKTRGAPAESGVLEAAEKMAANEKWVGRVQGAFRVGGKVLIVVGLANDAYRIYTATDKVKTTVEVAGGWAGATAAAGTFAYFYTPADAAGPLAWIGHGVGTLVAGGIGYWAGSGAARTVYELTVEGKPLEIGF